MLRSNCKTLFFTFIFVNFGLLANAEVNKHKVPACPPSCYETLFFDDIISDRSIEVLDAIYSRGVQIGDFNKAIFNKEMERKMERSIAKLEVQKKVLRSDTPNLQSVGMKFYNNNLSVSFDWITVIGDSWSIVGTVYNKVFNIKGNKSEISCFEKLCIFRFYDSGPFYALLSMDEEYANLAKPKFADHFVSNTDDMPNILVNKTGTIIYDSEANVLCFMVENNKKFYVNNLSYAYSTDKVSHILENQHSFNRDDIDFLLEKIDLSKSFIARYDSIDACDAPNGVQFSFSDKMQNNVSCNKDG